MKLLLATLALAATLSSADAGTQYKNTFRPLRGSDAGRNRLSANTNVQADDLRRILDEDQDDNDQGEDQDDNDQGEDED